MNDLQKLLKLRKIDVTELARQINCGYHSTQKNVRGVRKSPMVQLAIAAYFGLTREEAFGPTRSIHLQRLISEEIARHGGHHMAALQRRYLPEKSPVPAL